MFKSMKGRRTILAFAALIGLLVTATTIFVSSAFNVTGADTRKEKAVRNLDALRQKYAAVKTVHFAADAKIAIYGNNFRAGAGTYEYWAEGKRYRIKCRTDEHLQFRTDLDVAFDGKHFYFFDRRSGVLSYRQRDELRNQTALPNPFFLPVDYLSSDDDECAFCAMHLPDFKFEHARWDDRARNLEVKSQRHDESTGSMVEELEMPGGKLDGRPFKLRVRTVGASAAGAVQPTRIDRVTLDGKVMASINFSNFMPSALGQFPRNISVVTFDDNGNAALRVEFSVRTLEVNEPLENNIFTINFEEAEGVWNSDERKFVKEKRIKPAGSQNP